MLPGSSPPSGGPVPIGESVPPLPLGEGSACPEPCRRGEDSDYLDFVVEAPAARLDRYLAERQDRLTRAHIQKLIKEGLVTVNGLPVRASQRLRPSDRIRVTVPPPTPLELVPEPLPLSIVYEDADIIVVNKPAGLVVHPAPGHRHRTLVNALLAHCPDLAGIKGTIRPGIVHRLDKDTSGLLVVAKNDAAQQSLSRQIAQRAILKGYLALVVGRLARERGTVDAPIGRHPRDRKRMAVVPEGREAVTHYQVLSYYRDCTLVDVRPVTGRTHQIRVHMSYLGHPIVGDPIYGRGPARRVEVPRLFLHAYLLGFRRPSDGSWLELRSELPVNLEAALEPLSND